MDKLIKLRREPQRNFYYRDWKDMNEHACHVRVYKSTPEDVTLQLRREKDYITANLTVAQATELRDALTTILKEF